MTMELVIHLPSLGIGVVIGAALLLLIMALVS